MKSRKIITAVLLGFVMFSLSGCQLAREDKGEQTETIENEDRLIGALVSEERPVEERLYAKMVNLDTSKEYVFEEIEGFAFYSATIPKTETSESYITHGSADGISNVHSAVAMENENEKHSLEGTIYIKEEEIAEVIFYVNPIYQSPDGSVYAVDGNAFSWGSDADGALTTTLEETKSVTEDGETKSVSCSVKITLEPMAEPKGIVIVEMSADNSVCSRKTYKPGKLPECIVPEPVKKSKWNKLI